MSTFRILSNATVYNSNDILALVDALQGLNLNFVRLTNVFNVTTWRDGFDGVRPMCGTGNTAYRYEGSSSSFGTISIRHHHSLLQVDPLELLACPEGQLPASVVCDLIRSLTELIWRVGVANNDSRLKLALTHKIRTRS